MEKRQICSSKAPLRSVLSDHGSAYFLLGADLASPSEVASLLDRGRLDPGLPLLVISECVLVYMAPETVANLIQWTSSTFDLAYWLDYEPMNPNDAFGRMMIKNLKSRGCELLGMVDDIAAQQARFTDNGFVTVKAFDLGQVHDQLPEAMLRQMLRVEFLDELRNG